MDKNERDKYFSTNSFYTAGFLMSKGFRLINISRVNPRRAEFVFNEEKELEILLEDFDFAKKDTPSVMVDAREFIAAIKSLKDKLYQ